jgi:hypothetical protein
MRTCKKVYSLGGSVTSRCSRPVDHGGKCGQYRRKMVDQNNHRLREGDEVSFLMSDRRVGRNAYVIGRDQVDAERISIQLVGDPFPVGVLPVFLKKGHDQEMAAQTQERPDRKELRKLAQKIGIKDWEDMSSAQIWKQIQKAQAKESSNGKVAKPKKVPRGQAKTDRGEPVTPTEKAKAAKKTRKSTKKAPKTTRVVEPEVAENGNPFRPGSNAFLMTEMFLKGGVRGKMIDRLIKKIEFHPWAKKAKSIDPRHEMDKRMLMAIHQLQHKYGFTVVYYGGRGPEEGCIRVFPPDVAVPADLKAKAIAINGERTDGKKAKPRPTAKKVTKGKKLRKAASGPKASKAKPRTAKKTRKATKKRAKR